MKPDAPSFSDVADEFAQSNPPKPKQALNGAGRTKPKVELEVLNVSDLRALEIAEPTMLIEKVLPNPGAVLNIGKTKVGKTLFAAQCAIGVAAKRCLMDYYRIADGGGALFVEQDDPNGDGSMKAILERSPIAVDNIPFYFVRRVPVFFGAAFVQLIEEQIRKLNLRLVVLDSFTAMRESRGAGVDIVKAEMLDLARLDELGKRTNSTIMVIHHASKGAAGMDTFDQAAGTFAMSAAVEAQIHISRFPDLENNAPERLVRIRGRHLEDLELVIRFRKETLDYEHVLEGGAAPFYPLLRQIHSTFEEKAFTPKEFCHGIGVSRATAHRQIERLYRAGSLTKRGHGEYTLASGAFK